MVALARVPEKLRLDEGVFGKGVYGATEALRLVNFQRDAMGEPRSIARQTIGRLVRGYDY